MHVLGRYLVGTASIVTLCVGCASREDVASAPEAAVSVNGLSLNGIHFNGLSFNGLNFNGLHFNGLSFNGLTSNGWSTNGLAAGDLHLLPVRLSGLRKGGSPLPSVTLDGSVIQSVGSNGNALRGADLVGAEFVASLSNGYTLTLHLDAAAPSRAASDVMLYTVSANSLGVSMPLCGTDASGAPVKAIALSGSWNDKAGVADGGAHVDDASVITFACEGFALAKCVELGYAPWRTVSECETPGECHDLSLASFHQACTRMLRADYCGDGTATTRDGTEVDLWDDFSVQSDAAPGWTFEAEWSPSGATCVSETRWPTILAEGTSVRDYIRDHCGERWRPSACGGTGSSFFTENGYAAPLAARALLRTRVDH